MGKLSRFTQQLFGSSAGNNQMLEFGSLAAGSPQFYSGSTITPAIVQSLSNYLTGWYGAIVGSNSPCIQDMNALCYLFSYQLASLFQDGISEWDSATPYYTGSFASVSGQIYVSNIDANSGNDPTAGGSNWSLLPISERNSILNSAFDTWSRGTSIQASYNATSTFIYGADRWATLNHIGTSAVVTQEQVTGVLNGSIYGNKILVTGAPGTPTGAGAQIVHVLDVVDSQPYYGNLGSFAAQIKALGNVTSINLQFYYATSNSGVATALTAIGSPVVVTVNASTFTLGEIIGQAMGTSMTQSGVVAVVINVAGVSSGHASDNGNGFILEQTQMCPGSFIGNFRRAFADAATEQMALKAYFEKSFSLSQAPTSGTGSLGTALMWAYSANLDGSSGYGRTWRFQADKRVIPTMTLYNPGASSADQVWDYSGSASYAATTGETITGFSVSLSSGTPTAGDAMSTHFTADAEIY